VSTRTEKQAGGGGLSATTLAIASVSSVAAAYVIHTFWTGGVILGAGITPVIVAIVSESLKKPTQKITAIREERRSRSSVSRRTPDEVPVAPPPELERPDPFGIWQDDHRSRFHKVRGRPLKLAIATGLAAFAIAAFVVTGADLVFGSGNGGDRLKIVPGTQQREADTKSDDTTTTTQPAETTETVPEEEQPVPTEPPATTPAVPPATTPTPAPAEPAPAPPTTETPVPAPQEQAPAG
jgi:hypothetical protein